MGAYSPRMSANDVENSTGDRVRTLVDRLLFEQGQLDPLELLLAAELLAYEDYEAWRLGRRPELETALTLPAADAVALLAEAADYARRQGLEPRAVSQRGWAGNEAPLTVSSDAALSDACATVLAPPPERQQLDLFHDSGALLTEDALRDALAARRLDEAREQCARLLDQAPRHDGLQDYLRLIAVLDDAASAEQTPEQRLAELEAIEALARSRLGHRARDVLAALWAALAERLAARRFDPAAPMLHASRAWARAGRWDAARASIEAEPDWQRHPRLVLDHAEACWHRRDAAAVRRDWMHLCWEHPEAAEDAFAAPGFPDPQLAAFWNAFGDLDEPLDTEDFPAWLLLRDPAAALVPTDLAPDDDRGETYRLLHRLTSADDIEHRRALGDLHPQLLRLYLAQRP